MQQPKEEHLTEQEIKHRMQPEPGIDPDVLRQHGLRESTIYSHHLDSPSAFEGHKALDSEYAWGAEAVGKNWHGQESHVFKRRRRSSTVEVPEGEETDRRSSLP
ncbi:hypothetical protein J8273_3027 [Carpediemonas membranifera]|uniref:Uncharacterized protein n=1 Tax=Carpediemonas membranifera TaxID=201153 RepID=A0A8J6AZY1_9EUKA|nr:hypothetical protein J8273_3027 [Carpediemonas membranifera]|eukprot:KAG9395460.1 hypothetical protein J8273_3027 [Carpediemonas membranifera]